MIKLKIILLSSVSLISSCASNKHENYTKHDDSPHYSIEQQRAMLAKNTLGQGYGPQSPRDIDVVDGDNKVVFSYAPDYHEMNLCNIHFHKNAEHKGGEFTLVSHDNFGNDNGYKYSGHLNSEELKPVDAKVCPSEHGSLNPGDTIEVHYVYSTAQIHPGFSLNSCFNKATNNPELRVETQVFVLVNSNKSLDFDELSKVEIENGHFQARNILTNTGHPIQYRGSTTGPSYNSMGSPYQVTWDVHPRVPKVNIQSIRHWCQGNVFKEDHAHEVRNLVVNPSLLSHIE